MEHFSNGAFLKWSNSQMERFSNGAILKWSNSQMEQFSNGAIWGRHPMPYFKIPRTEKYGMRCARSQVTMKLVNSGPGCLLTEQYLQIGGGRFNTKWLLLMVSNSIGNRTYPNTGNNSERLCSKLDRECENLVINHVWSPITSAS